ncbi:MAG TPA: glycosyltransferase [Chthonomonadaceae bacterium]|nr:glycosyltransferase [Chthonomonadaceae bacterium]
MRVPIVYFYPGCRWEMPPGRHRLIMDAMAQHHPVIFLESPQHSGRLLETKRPRIEKRHDNLTVIHNAFGFRYARLGKKLGRLSAALDARWMHRELRTLGVTDYVYWLSANAPNALWGMRTERLVFDCIDPCFEPEGQEQFDRMEAEVVRQAKVVFCTAEALHEKLQRQHPHTYLVPNACAPEAYHPDATRPLSIPEPLKARPRPVVGFMGTFDWRVDTALLTEAAKRLPEYTFALLGRVNREQEGAVRELRGLPNVLMPGSVSEAEGFAYTAAFDVGLIPFLPGPINDAINPVKMYMYLVAGKPVVSTWVRECVRHAPYVRAAENTEAFVGAIRQAVADNDAAAVTARIAFALQNTWDVRAREALKHLKANGVLTEGLEPKRVEAV